MVVKKAEHLVVSLADWKVACLVWMTVETKVDQLAASLVEKKAA